MPAGQPWFCQSARSRSSRGGGRNRGCGHGCNPLCLRSVAPHPVHQVLQGQPALQAFKMVCDKLCGAVHIGQRGHVNTHAVRRWTAREAKLRAHRAQSGRTEAHSVERARADWAWPVPWAELGSGFCGFTHHLGHHGRGALRVPVLQGVAASPSHPSCPRCFAVAQGRCAPCSRAQRCGHR